MNNAAAQSQQQQRNTMNLADAARLFFAGHVAGMAGVCVGQPFDTIKVRLQTQRQVQSEAGGFTSAFQCLRSTLRNGGIFALYRGMCSPLLAVGAQKSLAFGVFGLALHQLAPGQGEKPLGYICVAGIAGGIANSLILTPVDQLKIAMQIQGYTPDSQPKLRVIAGRIISQQGIIHGLFGNFKATTIREISMYSIYYTLYNALQRTFLPPSDKSISPRSTIANYLSSLPPSHPHRVVAQLLCGGMTGVCVWGTFYPLDTIKSCMVTQTALNLPTQQRKSIWQITQHIYNNGGIRQFYIGVRPALLRAFPVHACIFFTYELIIKWTARKQL